MTPSIRAALAALLLAAVLGGCSATRGTPFERSEVPELELGKTRRDAITSALGTPFSFGFVTKNQFEYTVYSWSYTEASAGSVRNRLLRAGFGPDDKLAFYVFQSNFESDSTDFDITALRNLSAGRTTAEEILSRLGEPPGRDITFIGGQRYKTWIYSVTRLENADHPVVKRATLHFDEGVLQWSELQGEGFVLD